MTECYLQLTQKFICSVENLIVFIQSVTSLHGHSLENYVYRKHLYLPERVGYF